MSLLMILMVAAAVVAFFTLRSGENLRFETSCDSFRVVMAAVGVVGAKRGWQTMAQSDRGADFKYHQQPRMLVAIILLLCFLIPGIVYIVLAGKHESLVLNVDSGMPGMTIVQITSNGFRGKFAGRALQRQVSVPAGAMGTGAAPMFTAGRN
ncbi:MAG TPA: hypothetical protein VLJ42_04140 [Solirubrobacteraceae bacterium]|nr:hypothetical protein [Solirubrobacteraceae bacterium]